MFNASATRVNPSGLGRVLLILSISFLILTAVVIILRCIIRLKYKTFGIDDGLMLTGWVLHVAHTTISIQAIYAGLGINDNSLNSYQQQSILKYTWVAGLISILSLMCLKCSICITLLRIAVKGSHRKVIWTTMVFILGTLIYAAIANLAACIPISANWDHQSSCSPTFRISGGYVLSISAIVSDWICSILPIFMLYKSNMQKATKVSVSIILGLAVFASIFSIIRLPYYKSISTPGNLFYNIAYIYLWSMLETGFGTIAGSLHTLRKFFNSYFHFNTSIGSSTAYTLPFSGTNRAVIISQSVATGEEHIHWEQLEDNEASPGQKIHVKVDLEMQSLERPQTPQGSDGSHVDLVRLSRG